MKWWNDYWFQPAPYLDLAMVRIIVVATQLFSMTVIHGGYSDWMEWTLALPEGLYQPIPVLRFLVWPLGWDYRPSLEVLQAATYLGVAGGCLALVGLWTNVGLLMMTFGLVFVFGHAYSYGDFHHTEAPVIITLAMLALSPSGRALSLDALWRKRRNPAAADPPLLRHEGLLAGWPVKLIQWLFVLIYLSAVLSKLVFAGGLAWLNGFTLQYYLISDGMWRGSLLGLWLAQQHTLVWLSQHAVILFQLTFSLAVIFPKLRWIYVPAGLGFHVGNMVFLNAGFVEWLGLYSVFVPWRALFALLSRRGAALPERSRASA